MNTPNSTPPAANPAAAPAAPAALAVPVEPQPFSGGTIRGMRAQVIEQVNNSALTPAKKAALLEDIGAVDVKLDLLQVDFHQHPYKAGVNVTWTVTEL